jgi:peptidoglycan/LPS O-acetylase OafA/YrhL
LAGLDGVRAVAACSIVLLHVAESAEPQDGRYDFGWVSREVVPHLAAGVTLFFVLSGFLLYLPHVRAAIDGVAPPSIASYVRSRAWRILPAYWVTLAFSGYVLGTTQLRRDGHLVAGSLSGHPKLAVVDALLLHDYVPHALATGIGPAWSLCVEVAFYGAVPLLGILALRMARQCRSDRGRVAAACAPILVMLLIGWSGRALGAFVLHGDGPAPGWDADWASVLDRSFLGNADLFAPGMALAVLWHCVATSRVRLFAAWRPAALFLLAGGAFVAHEYATYELGTRQSTSYYLYSPLTSLCAVALVALVALPAATGERPRMVAALDSRVVGGVGLVSYSLFLVHAPLIDWLQARGATFSGRLGFVMTVAVVFTVSFACAAASYVAVERPALRRRSRPPRAAVATRAG